MDYVWQTVSRISQGRISATRLYQSRQMTANANMFNSSHTEENVGWISLPYSQIPAVAPLKFCNGEISSSHSSGFIYLVTLWLNFIEVNPKQFNTQRAKIASGERARILLALLSLLCHAGKPSQLTWRSGTQRRNLRVPDLKMSWSDLKIRLRDCCDNYGPQGDHLHQWL